MPDKEATARIKINKLLEAAGWRFFAEGNHAADTCVLEPGAHVFVQQRSFVFYRYARIEQGAHILRLVEQGVFKPHEPMSAQLLQQIKVGLFDSPHTKREFKRMRF